ncbi:hypothetical protein FOZ63_000669, partial [Perkinsus olseni]
YPSRRGLDKNVINKDPLWSMIDNPAKHRLYITIIMNFAINGQAAMSNILNYADRERLSLRPTVPTICLSNRDDLDHKKIDNLHNNDSVTKKMVVNIVYVKPFYQACELCLNPIMILNNATDTLSLSLVLSFLLVRLLVILEAVKRMINVLNNPMESSSATGQRLPRPYPNLRPLLGVTAGKMYRPPNLFGNYAYDRCPGCKRSVCKREISNKDYQGVITTAKGLSIKNPYRGADDQRSGVAWIQEIFKRTIGQRNVVRYTFARLNTIQSVWDDLVRDEPPPAQCYLDYDLHWDRLINKINDCFSDQEALMRLQHDFNHLQQDPKESITQFIARLDSSANQLCLLGVGILDNVIKRRLYDGLLSDRLRDKMDRDVDDHRVDYTEFKRLLVKYDRRKKTSSRSTKKEVDPATLRLYGGRLPDQRHNATVNHIMGTDTVEEDQDIEYLHGSNQPDDDTYYVYAVVRDQQSITCYRCLQDGHPARDCTNDIGKKDDRCSRCGNPTHGIDKCNVSITATCHRCGRQGHLAYVCPDPLPTSTSRNKGSKGKGKASSKGKGKPSNARS